MTVSLICLLVSLVLLLLVALCGIFGGLRKGALRAAVKLAALVLSVVIALVISLCLRGLVADLLVNVIPSELSQYQAIVELIVQIPASLGLLIVFWLLFSIIRALMLIPQTIICKHLPKTFEEFTFKSTAESEALPSAPLAEEATADDAPASENAYAAAHAEAYADVPEASSVEPPLDTASLPTAEAESAEPPLETAPQPNLRSRKIIWQSAAAFCGLLSSLLLLGALMMPVSGIVTRGGDALYRVTDVLEKEQYGGYSDEISDYAHAAATAPLFTVTDFFYGKTVFEPLTTFKSEFGKINLSSELENATDIACEVLPIAIHLDREGALRDEDIAHLSAAAQQMSESDFVMSVGTYFISYTGRQLEGDTDTSDSAAQATLRAELGSIMTDMSPDALSADLDMLVSLVDALSDSPLLQALTADDRKLSASDLIERESMRTIFGILYDNSHSRQLFVPLVNLGVESIFKAIGAQPVYSEADLSKAERGEVIEEADLLCTAAEGLSEFTESLEAEGSDITTYRLKDAGKALDCLRTSILFGDQYEAMVESLTALASNGDDQSSDSLIPALNDALCAEGSAESLLESAQSIAILNKAFENTEQKGSENDSLMSAMDTLLYRTESTEYDVFSDLSGSFFVGSSTSENTEKQAEMTEDFIDALTVVSAQESKNTSAEADALQTIYDLMHSEPAAPFSQASEEETVDALLASDIAFEMLSTLNDEGRDYGIRAKLNDSNRAKIASAISASNASDDRKAVVSEFFGIR